MPCTLMVYDAIVSEEVLGRWRLEQEHEIVVSVLRRKCTRNKSVNEDVSGVEVLGTGEVSQEEKRKRDQLN